MNILLESHDPQSRVTQVILSVVPSALIDGFVANAIEATLMGDDGEIFDSFLVSGDELYKAVVALT